MGKYVYQLFCSLHRSGARREPLPDQTGGNNGISLNVADRIVSKFPQIDKLWLLTGEGQMFADARQRGMQIPFYNTDVEQHIASLDRLEAECDLVVLPVGDCDLAMVYNGRAMGAVVPPGTIVLLKAIDTDAIIPGEEYVIVCQKNCNFANSSGRRCGGKIPPRAR